MITNKIGENAGLIWSALQGGELTTKDLKKATKLKVNNKFLYSFKMGKLIKVD